ncbi:Uncharacterised protein [uncultured archaeon]|nr:Uncharacterised protein [uncultured archaeon]
MFLFQSTAMKSAPKKAEATDQLGKLVELEKIKVGDVILVERGPASGENGVATSMAYSVGVVKSIEKVDGTAKITFKSRTNIPWDVGAGDGMPADWVDVHKLTAGKPITIRGQQKMENDMLGYKNEWETISGTFKSFDAGTANFAGFGTKASITINTEDGEKTFDFDHIAEFYIKH